MSDYMNEQEIITILKKLDADTFMQDGQQAGEQSHSTHIAQQLSEESVHGTVRVEQGKIIIEDPLNGGKPPTIKAASPVRLLIDGQEVRRKTNVSTGNIVEWSIHEDPLFEISVSPDKLKAYVTIRRSRRHAWVLTDQPAEQHLKLTASEDATIILETIDLSDIMDRLEDIGIRMNLDVAAIQAELLNPSGVPVAIACGKPPVQGEDAKVEMYFSENVESAFIEVRGMVDFKNHLNIPSVKNGDIIARKTPPVEGQAGYDVYGDVLLPDPVKDIRIAGKSHVEITPDFEVIARKEGRPRVTGNQIRYFDINTAYIVPGNVDLSTGNIVFAGDVVVYGNVMDNMIIESLGNIYVSGSVYHATLTATGSIAVRGNVIKSKIYSGYFGMLYNRFYNISKQLIDILEKMSTSARMLQHELDKKNKQVRYGQLIVLIMESKYRMVGDVLKDLLGVISSIQTYQKDALQQLTTYLKLFLQPTQIIDTMTAPRMEDFLRILREAQMRVALSQENEVRISINQGQQSVFKSNGDILIRKEGVIQCDLYSARNIVFYEDESVCRGSNLEAGDTIYAMSVGGVTGVGTFLKAGKKVAVKKMLGGRVVVDRYSMDIFEPVEERIFDRHSFRQTAPVKEFIE